MTAAETKTMVRTVLLADDSPTIQRVVELTFAGENVNVVAVGDGRSAIDAIRQAPPDVVLADIGMPGCTGYDVLAFVRGQPALASLPVLLLAGAFEEVDPAEAARRGADGVLSKPFDPAVLVDRVGELLSHGRVANRPAAGAAVPPPQPTWSPADASAFDAVAAKPSASSSDRDRYFEEIDEAFAMLSRTPRPVPPSGEDEGEEEPVDETETGETTAESPSGVEAAADAGTEAAAGDAKLTDAFAALLDAETTGTPVDELWPSPPAPPAGDPVDIERLADLVARRVLEQLSERVIRDTVSDIVSTTAERLVQQEIDRIKRHIK
jgi:CheY-like chemotaxis protein